MSCPEQVTATSSQLRNWCEQPIACQNINIDGARGASAQMHFRKSSSRKGQGDTWGDALGQVHGGPTGEETFLGHRGDLCQSGDNLKGLQPGVTHARTGAPLRHRGLAGAGEK